MSDFDAIDAIVEQWNKEIPELEVQPMAIIGRLMRCSVLLQPKLEKVFFEAGFNSWGEFDALATLLRSGPPYCLAPTELFSTLMITSGTMTHRTNQLEKRGLISREANLNDARSKLVKLTKKGEDLIRPAMPMHVANEKQILDNLSDEKQAELNDALKHLLAILELY